MSGFSWVKVGKVYPSLALKNKRKITIRKEKEEEVRKVWGG